MNQQNPTIIAILNVVLSYFPDNILSPESQLYNSVSSLVESFLLHQISYNQLFNTVKSLVGYTKPIEKLQIILQSGPDPIPAPSDDEIARSKYRRKSRPWTSYEDQRLLCAIFNNGIENWTQISKFVGNGRTRSQCSQRWYRGLDPKICKSQWSKEEERKLVDLVRTHGDKSWTNIATKMGNRSDVQCRYRYKQLQRDNNLMKKHKKSPDLVDDEDDLKSISSVDERPRSRGSKRHQAHETQPVTQPKRNQPFQVSNQIEMAQNYPPMQPVQQFPPMYCMPPIVQQQNQNISLNHQNQQYQQEIIQLSPVMIHPSQMVQNQQLYQTQLPPQPTLPPIHQPIPPIQQSIPPIQQPPMPPIQQPPMPPIQQPPMPPIQQPIPPIQQPIYYSNQTKTPPSPTVKSLQTKKVQTPQQIQQNNSPLNSNIIEQQSSGFERQNQSIQPFVKKRIDVTEPLHPINENTLSRDPSPFNVQLTPVSVASQSPGTILLGIPTPMPTASPMASIQSPRGYLSIPVSTEVYTVDRMDRSKVHTIQAPAFDGKMYSVY
ncbi:hypothetical protein M9Y10_011186 [Tritrichomonas musculus]|uniref:Myb-like DNA-binding domain containing protein n=1 Tax=Tritrichomonas musculus TaxID=1915356 RepID=A0ABR2IIT5_9EUKA